jgi:O-antigen/teichoic acid export membrane protein
MTRARAAEHKERTVMKKLNVELGKMGLVVVPMVLQPLLNFCFLLLVARQAPMEQYGALALSLVLVSVIVGFADLGLRDFLLGKGAIRRGLSTGENLFFPSLLGFVTLASASLLYTRMIGDVDIAFVLLVVALPEAFAFGVLQRSLFFHYQMDNRLIRFSAIDALHKSMPFAVKLVLFWLTGNLVLAVACGAALAILSYLAWFRLVCLSPKGFFSAQAHALRALITMARLWRTWLPFTVSFFAFFLYFGSDRLLIEALLGAEALAVYTAAYSFIALGQILVTAFWSLYMPRISRGDQVFTQARFLQLAVCLSVGLVLGYQLFAWYLFPHFYPPGYAAGALIMAVMSGYFVFRLVNVVFEMHWVAKDRYPTFVRMRVACGLLSVALNALCIPLYGLIAPAVIVIVCEALLTLLIGGSEWRWRYTRAAATTPGSIDRLL